VELVLAILVSILAWRYYRGRYYYSPYSKYSTFWPRVWAAPIDSLFVQWPAGVLIALLPYCNWSAERFLLLYVALSLSPTIYSIALHTKYGQTVGKRVCKVRVVDFKTEDPIHFGQALLRDAVPLVIFGALLAYQSLRVITGKLPVERLVQPEEDFGISPWLSCGIPAVWLVLEIVTTLTNHRRRALHDFIAGTVVVRTNTE